MKWKRFDGNSLGQPYHFKKLSLLFKEIPFYYLGHYLKKGFYSGLEDEKIVKNELLNRLVQSFKDENDDGRKDAISSFGDFLEMFFKETLPEKRLNINIDNVYLLPSITSDNKDDPRYDKRLHYVIKRVSAKVSNVVSLENLVNRKDSTEPLHIGNRKRNSEGLEESIKELVIYDENLRNELYESLSSQDEPVIFFLDDVISSGMTFKAQAQFLYDELGIDNLRFVGLFLALYIGQL